MSEITIAIPAHDRGENGPQWMRELLDSIKKQTFKDIDIVVSDQSKNDLKIDFGIIFLTSQRPDISTLSLLSRAVFRGVARPHSQPPEHLTIVFE